MKDADEGGGGRGRGEMYGVMHVCTYIYVRYIILAHC